MSQQNPGLFKLSPREKEVLRLTLGGHTQKEIARLLDIGPTTVKTHAKAACMKLGKDTTRAAARILAEHECLSPATAAAVLLEGGPPTKRIPASASGDDTALTGVSRSQDALGRLSDAESRPLDQGLSQAISKSTDRSSVMTWGKLERTLKTTSTAQWLAMLVFVSIALGLTVSSLLFISAHMLQTIDGMIP